MANLKRKKPAQLDMAARVTTVRNYLEPSLWVMEGRRWRDRDTESIWQIDVKKNTSSTTAIKINHE